MTHSSNALICKCGKTLKSNMEIEYSRHMTEFFCSPECATDAYFSYLESAPIDFENDLPSGVTVTAAGVLVRNDSR